VHPLTDCIRLTDIAPAKCQQTRYRSEFTAASRGFPATAWLSSYNCTCVYFVASKSVMSTKMWRMLVYLLELYIENSAEHIDVW